jgi:hypothetical protein
MSELDEAPPCVQLDGAEAVLVGGCAISHQVRDPLDAGAPREEVHEVGDFSVGCECGQAEIYDRAGTVLNRVLLGALVSAALASWSCTARAEPTRAESLFLEGRAELRAGRLEAACALFEQSFASSPAPGTLLNWGLCEERRRHYVGAWEKLRRFIGSVQANDERLQLAERHLQAIESHVALLRIQVVPETIQRPLVFVDGALLDPGKLGDFFAIEVGEHSIELKAAGKLLHAKAVSLAARQRLDLLLAGVDIPAPVPDPIFAFSKDRPATGARPIAHPQTRGKQPSNQAAYVAGTFAATGFLASLVFGGIALREKELTETHCRDKRCDDAGLRATEAGRRYVALANVGLVVGAAGAVTCGVLLWQSRAGQRQVSVSLNRVAVTQRWTF